MKINLRTNLACAFSLLIAMLILLPSTTDAAARGRVHVGVSPKGALTVLTDRGTLLRGRDFWMRTNPEEGEICVADVRNSGLNMIHMRCEDNMTGTVRMWELPQWKTWMDNIVDWCEKYDLYVIIVYSTGYNGAFNDGRTEFWEYMAPRYKDRTHVIFEPENESWNGNQSIGLYKRVRQLAPQTHLVLFTFPTCPGINDPAIVAAKAAGIDFSNASVGYHPYDRNGGAPDNLPGWKAAGLALVETEFFYWAATIVGSEKAGVSWVLFLSDHDQTPDQPKCNFVNVFPTVMAKAIQTGGSMNPCWIPDYGSVPGCNTPSGPFIQLSKLLITPIIARGNTAPPESVTVTGTNMGTTTLTSLTTSIVYKSGTNWLSVAQSGTGNQQLLVNTLNATSLSAGTYEAEVTVSAPSAQQAKYTIKVTVVDPRIPENPSNTTAGLAYSYYEGSWTTVPAFSALTAKKSNVASIIDLSVATAADNFGLQFTGYITVPTTGAYTFTITSDDGSNVYIGNQRLINNDGSHADQTNAGSIVLGAGKHAITVDYFEATGGQTLSMTWEGPGIAVQSIPASALSHVNGTKAMSRNIARDRLHPMTLSRNSSGLEVNVGIDGAYVLEAFGLDGRRISAFAGSGPRTLLLSKKQLPTGTYLLRLSGSAGAVATNK